MLKIKFEIKLLHFGPEDKTVNDACFPRFYVALYILYLRRYIYLLRFIIVF